MTDGMVGAELANIVEVAAINMMRDGRTEVCFCVSTLPLFFGLDKGIFMQQKPIDSSKSGPRS